MIMSKEVLAAWIGAAGLVVAALIGGGYALMGRGDGPPVAPRPPGQENAMVDITIHDELGSNQYSEALNIEIDGQSKGDLVIDGTSRPEAEMTFSVNPGTHKFEIQGNTQALAADGSYQQFPVQGNGDITISEEDNQSFDVVQAGVSGNTIIADLQES